MEQQIQDEIYNMILALEHQTHRSAMEDKGTKFPEPASALTHEVEGEEEELTVTLPSNEDIALHGRLVRWKHLSVLVNNIQFRMPRSRLIQVFRSFGPLRLEHMPRHLPHRHDSHRGFAVFTYVTAHHTKAALRDAPARLAEAGY